MQHNNHTDPCPRHISLYIRNLTSSYTYKRNESGLVSASVIMFILAGLFFNLNILSRGVSNIDVSATVSPNVRLFLSSALSIFLLVMSYLFSEAKNTSNNDLDVDLDLNLSLRAVQILTWMLLSELIRKKVDEVRMHGYSGTIQRAARVIWLGNLVFFNIHASGQKAVFTILWILCATKLVQRVAYTEAGKRSYAHGKNPRVISSYMAQMMMFQHNHHHRQEHQLVNSEYADQADQAVHGDQLLRRCKYVVMGEEKLVVGPTADGYKLDKITVDDGSIIVTVGNVWELAEKDKLFPSLDQNQNLNGLCLSFALFKLLRRRLEHVKVPMTNEEAQNCRDLILKGLYGSGESAAEVFQVFNDELTFLSEYYHSVVPVVFASPFFLFVNYFLAQLVVVILCLMAIVICGNGDVSYAFASIFIDNYTLQSGYANIVPCLVSRAPYSPAAFFSIVDLFITVILFIIFFYEEIWEFFVFLLSDWFMVSMLCNYIGRPQWRESPAFSWSLRVIMWLRSYKSHGGNLILKQFSMFNLGWPLNIPLIAIPSLVLKTELVPKTLMQSITDYLVEHDCGTTGYAPLSNGHNALCRNNLSDKLSWACLSESITEVILTWHVATSILEMKSKCFARPTVEEVEEQVGAASTSASTSTSTSSNMAAAIMLSKYCAYLVAFYPELLPDDNQENAVLLLDDMKKELKAILGCRDYYMSLPPARVEKIMERIRVLETTGQSEIQVEPDVFRSDHSQVVMNGAKLGKMLIDEANSSSTGQETVWKVLADVWTELIIFVAPSSHEDRLKRHEEVLLQGGEFITVLWALTMHMGIARPPKPTSAHLEPLWDLCPAGPEAAIHM